MKRVSWLVSGFTLLLPLGFGPVALSQEVSVAEAAGLAPDQIAELQRAGIPVALPTDVPEGFEVTALRVQPIPEDYSMAGGYAIVYRATADQGGPYQACFEVEAAIGGFGGPEPEYRMDAAIPPFAQPWPDYTYQVFWSNGGEVPFPEPILFTDWIEADGAFYRVGSLVTERQGCDRISPELANQILGSLRYLDSTPE